MSEEYENIDEIIEDVKGEYEVACEVSAEVDENRLLQAFESAKLTAAEMLKDDGEMDRFLTKLEKKVGEVPVLGTGLSHVPALASLTRSFVIKEYTLAPMGTMTAIVGALLYWISPIDIIPDMIPGIGYVDDAVVIALCWKLVEADVESYQEWREEKRAAESDAD